MHHHFKYTKLILLVGPLVVLALFAVFVYEFEPRDIEAGTAQNTYGYAWSSNIGWVRFNDCVDPLNAATCAAPSFGVNVDPLIAGISQLSGYAWSNNVGWLSFDAPTFGGLRPSAYLDAATNELRGWARFCSAATTPATCDGSIGPGPSSGGWDGWVSLNCLDGGNCAANPYRVKIDACSVLNGFAWGGDVAGWLKFRSESAEEPPAYGVSVKNLILPPPPPINVAIDNLGISQFWCENSPDVHPLFAWDYVDPCGLAPQTAFRIQVAQDSNGVAETTDFGGVLVYDTCPGGLGTGTCLGGFSCPSGSRCSYSPLTGVPEFIYNRVAPNGYVLRVQSFNANGWSGWSVPVLFNITRPHAAPAVSFSYTPQQPFIDEPVTFDSTPNTRCFNTGGSGNGKNPIPCPTTDSGITPWVEGYLWNFGGGTQIGGTVQIPIATFSAKGNYVTTLDVTNGDGFFCSDLQNIQINVKFKIPEWREIAP